MKTIFSILCLLLTSVVQAQVDDVLNVKNTYSVYEPIVIGCTCDTNPDSTVKIFWRTDLDTKTVEVDSGKGLHAWCPPGEHWVEATVITQQFREITVLIPDPEAPLDQTKYKTEKIKIVTNTLIERHDKKFIVGQAPQPPPTPDPTPVPPVPVPSGTRDILIFRETRVSTPEEANLIKALRSGPSAQYLQSKKHNLTVLDVDSLDEKNNPSPLVQFYQAAIREGPLPLIIINDHQTKKQISKGGLPKTPELVLDLIKKSGG